MKLTAEDLRFLATMIEKLADVQISVSSFRHKNLTIDLVYEDDQRDGRFVYISAIREPISSNPYDR
jgi:hypothetical protein